MKLTGLLLIALALAFTGCSKDKTTKPTAAAKTDMYIHQAQTTGGLTTTGGVCKPENIESVMSKYGSQLRSCYTKHVPNNPNLGGEVTLNFTIQSSGAITGIGTSQSTLHHAGVESCLQDTVKGAQFAKINGTCTVKWPFTFNQKNP